MVAAEFSTVATCPINAAAFRPAKALQAGRDDFFDQHEICLAWAWRFGTFSARYAGTMKKEA